MTTTKQTTKPEDDWDRDLGPGFKTVDTDLPELGEKIDWKKEPIFRGIYKGETHVQSPNQRTGEIESVTVFQFEDETGLRFAWNTPRLTRGLAEVQPSDEVAIRWLGKEDLPGGRTMNNFDVRIRPAD
jgi:hypothetical protein